MGNADIDLESVSSFRQKFDSEYLSVQKNFAGKLKQAASSASATLGSTNMSTCSADNLEKVADAILKAVRIGEERILELEKKAKRELDEKNRIEDMCK